MAEGEEQVELKFRIYDGTDIGHGTYISSTAIATLKQRLVDEWPQGYLLDSHRRLRDHYNFLLFSLSFKLYAYVECLAHHHTDKSVAPKSAGDIKLIHAGRVLDDGGTLAESRIHIGDVSGGVITMHVVVQPLDFRKKTEKNLSETQTCVCAIL